MKLWNEKFSPMLLAEIDKPFNSKDYIYEIKYDGVRVLVYVSPKKIKIINRNLNDMTYLFPELDVLKNKVTKKVIFDGEIISEKDGKPSFSKLQERLHLKNKSKIKKLSMEEPITLVAFDILYEDKNLIDLPLIQRKNYLNKYEDDDLFIKSFYVEEKGKELFKKIQKLDLEGIIAKKKNGKYYINTRCDEWTKIKNFKCEEFYICGYNIKKSEYVISILLGEYVNNKLMYVGSCSLSKKNPLYEKIINSKIIKNQFENYKDKGSFIKPIFKIKINYMERTKDNHLRQPFVKNEKPS